MKTAYSLSKLLRLARPEIEQFTEQRNTIVRELGAERPTTELERAQSGQATAVEVTAENRATFFTKVNELASIEVTFDVQPLSVAAFDGVQVSAVDLLALDPFLVG